LLKQEFFSSKFNLSPNYIGAFFKKQTGESLQQFIINYKLCLVPLGVSYSHLMIGAIADELGFTAESYLSRLCRIYYGLTPLAYRMERRKNELQKKIH
jgi:AraC-like DNA-binding protein